MSDMPNETCAECGGEDFYFERGTYFCNDCGTRVKDVTIRTAGETHVSKKKSRTVKKKSKANEEERLTSWECYNYIALGLVKELIELGASENLKSTVEVLWFQYLKKNAVIGKPDIPPKLPAYNTKTDADIIYGRKRVKKRKRSSENHPTDTTILDKERLQQERTRQKTLDSKRKAEAEVFSQTQPTQATFVNESLSCIKTTQEGADKSKFLLFNNMSKKEILKTMSKKHFREHCRDVNSTMTCHKFSIRSFSRKYLESASVLSRIKLYSIVYLGLLINKEEIQLANMLRYVREGHLSFDHCDHFFPEEIVEKQLNVCTFTQGNQPMTSLSIRNYTAKMAVYLNVNHYIPVQNLCQLSKRYCQELNLPDEIYNHVLNLLSRSEPKMSADKSEHSTPNYEARAMSFIIFVLKLFFGLDDATEFELSNLAKAVDTNFYANEKKPFNLETWLKHIEYRKLILTNHHFPTKYLDDDYSSPDSFISFMTWYKERVELNIDLSQEMVLIKDLLAKISDTSLYNVKKFDFSRSLTPYRDYLNVLLTSPDFSDKQYLVDLLNVDFSTTSLDYIDFMQSYKSLLLPRKKLTYKHGGKNDNIIISNLFNKDVERRRKQRNEDKDINVTFAKSGKNATIRSYDLPPPKRFRDDSESVMNNFAKTNAKIYEVNKKRNEKKQDKFETSNVRVKNINVDIDNCIYNPSERFWVNLQDISAITQEDNKNFFKPMPTSFKLLLKECARIIEQTEKDLYMEYSLVEAFLCYSFNVKSRRFSNEKVVNAELSKMLKRAKKLW